jgi:hypothetical protein
LPITADSLGVGTVVGLRESSDIGPVEWWPEIVVGRVGPKSIQKEVIGYYVRSYVDSQITDRLNVDTK